MRKDKKRTANNEKQLNAIKSAFKKLKSGGTKTAELVKKYYSAVDRAVKNKLIHRNKGNRMKSKVAQFKKKK